MEGWEAIPRDRILETNEEALNKLGSFVELIRPQDPDDDDRFVPYSIVKTIGSPHQTEDGRLERDVTLELNIPAEIAPFEDTVETLMGDVAKLSEILNDCLRVHRYESFVLKSFEDVSVEGKATKASSSSLWFSSLLPVQKNEIEKMLSLFDVRERINEQLKTIRVSAENVFKTGEGKNGTNVFSTDEQFGDLLNYYARHLSDYAFAYEDEHRSKENVDDSVCRCLSDCKDWRPFLALFLPMFDDFNTKILKSLSTITTLSKTINLNPKSELTCKEIPKFKTLVSEYAIVFETLHRWCDVIVSRYPETWRIGCAILQEHSADIGAHKEDDHPFKNVYDVLSCSNTISAMKSCEENIKSFAYDGVGVYASFSKPFLPQTTSV